MTAKKTIAAIIVAGGTGSRFGKTVPKQYAEVHGKPLLAHTLYPFITHPRVKYVQCVILAENKDFYADTVVGMPLLDPVTGGATRQDSVRAGLDAVADYKPDYVMIHDAARPNICMSDLDKLITELDAHEEGAILAQPIYDTVKCVKEGYIEETLPREQFYRAQTPQMFVFDAIYDAHQKAIGMNFTDDAAIAESAGMKIKIVAGPSDNIKVTNAEDLKHVVNAYAK